MDETKKIECNIPLPPPVIFVIERLSAAGFEAYAVGGAVRDHVMGKTPVDYDVTTSATPDEMLCVFEGERVVETGLKHGTLTVVRDGMNIETTTYRIDGAYADGRHPDCVEFTSLLSEDLCRRDFTINAMAYSPDGYLIDLFGGKEDIDRRTVRCVGRASVRFGEDGLRILRALRFSSVLGFTPDEECAEAIFSQKHLLKNISRERIYTEITKLITGRCAATITEQYAQIIAYVMPPLTAEGIRRSASAFLNYGPDANVPSDLRYALLFESLDEAEAAEAFSSLKPSSEEKRSVLNLVRSRGREVHSEYDVLVLMRDFGDYFPARFAELQYAAGRITAETAQWITDVAEKAVRDGAVRRVSDLSVGGADMISLGLRGEAIGRTLKKLLDLVMRGEISNSPAELTEYAKKLI